MNSHNPCLSQKVFLSFGMLRMKSKLGNLASVAAIVLIAPVVSQAALTSYEPFSAYTVPAQLPSAGNPTVAGYTGSWVGTDFGTQRPGTLSGSLNYSDPLYLPSTGDRVGVPSNTGGDTPGAASGRAYRMLDSSLIVTSSTTGTRYLSFLFQRGTGTGSNIYQTLALGNAASLDSNRHFDIGVNASTQYNFGVNNIAGTGQDYFSTLVNTDTNVHLFVVKFTLSAANLSDSVTVWLDPVLGGVGDPVGGTTVSGRNLTWDRLALSDYDDNSAAWDEIRWGTTFNSVTLVPEPSSLALIGCAACLCWTMSRRRR